jgi:hypothetical protein
MHVVLGVCLIVTHTYRTCVLWTLPTGDRRHTCGTAPATRVLVSACLVSWQACLQTQQAAEQECATLQQAVHAHLDWPGLDAAAAWLGTAAAVPCAGMDGWLLCKGATGETGRTYVCMGMCVLQQPT